MALLLTVVLAVFSLINFDLFYRLEHGFFIEPARRNAAEGFNSSIVGREASITAVIPTATLAWLQQAHNALDTAPEWPTAATMQTVPKSGKMG